ncbi:MAG: NAD(P)H-dependent glycerol-3-phosphate dehydrogenase [Acidobacteriota bacterium]
MKISIFGGGTWGTALSIQAGRAGNDVLLWVYDKGLARVINSERENTAYLPGCPIPAGVRATEDFAECASFSNSYFVVVPSHFCRGVYSRIAELAADGTRIMSATKGIEEDTCKRMEEVAAETVPQMKAYAVLAGPSFALEVGKAHPTTVVIASKDQALAQEFQQALNTSLFRVYVHSDVLGVELAASLKNVIALASGIVSGLGFGLNTQAALITRGLHEITRLALTMGARAETMAGLAGIGDLVLTCTGGLSRNRWVGEQIGQGRKLSEILSTMTQVAEGVRTTRSATQLAHRLGVVMPITFEMHSILYEDKPPAAALKDLMERSLKKEY